MLVNPKIAQANPESKVNKAFIDALYQEAYKRYATVTEQAQFKSQLVKDASNVILGSNSPWFNGNVRVEAVVPPLLWPLKTVVITQKFGERPEVYQQFGLTAHNGTDLKTKSLLNPFGKQEVMACADGVVEQTRFDKDGYGTHLRIRTQGLGLVIYGHLSRLMCTQGQMVKRGQVIGISGNTGFSSAPHLHIEVRPDPLKVKNGFAGAVNPLQFLPTI